MVSKQLTMNLKLVGIIITVGLVGLVSYYVSTKLIGNTEKASYFEKNRVCVQSKNDIEKKLAEQNVDDESQEELIEVFYSKEYDSCMYIVELTQNVFERSDGWKSTKRLMDYRMSLKSTPIDTCEYISSKLEYSREKLSLENNRDNTTSFEEEHKRIEQDSCKVFDQRISELKISN